MLQNSLVGATLLQDSKPNKLRCPGTVSSKALVISRNVSLQSSLLTAEWLKSQMIINFSKWKAAVYQVLRNLRLLSPKEIQCLRYIK